MDKREKQLLDLRIDIVNTLEVCVLMAKHRAGAVSDEEYREQIERVELMLKNSQKEVAMSALDRLMDILSEKEKEE